MNIAKPEERGLEEVKDSEDKQAELKMDGSRMLLISDGESIKFVNKRGNEKTELYPEFEDLNLPECIIDGEMVVKDEENPHGNFRKLMRRDSGNWSFKKKLLYKKHKATYCAFDVLEWDGENYRSVPLKSRREQLEQICEDLHAHIEAVPVFEDISDAWVTQVEENNYEGLIVKDLNAGYPEGRTDKWIKIKNTEDLVRKVHNIEEHSKGIRVETKEEGQGLTINGERAGDVKRMIENEGEAEIEVTCLEIDEDGTMREPVFKKIV